jgi:hypothetical protein
MNVRQQSAASGPACAESWLVDNASMEHNDDRRGLE